MFSALGYRDTFLLRHTAYFGGCGANTDNAQWITSEGSIAAALGVR